MKILKTTLILSAIFILAITSPVYAQRGGYRGGGYRGYGYGGHFYGWGYYRGYYPYWYSPFFWGAPIVGWPYAGWPYASYGGWPYYPPEVTEAPPAYSEPAPEQPYYWYYCQNPQGYYPYVKSCPGGWITVMPNVTPSNQQVPGVVRPSRLAVPPPPSRPEFTPPPSGVYPPPATGEPGTGNFSPPHKTSQITPNPNQKRCQKWAPTGEVHNESRWNPQKQTMETVSVPNFAWQDYPCE